VLGELKARPRAPARTAAGSGARERPAGDDAKNLQALEERRTEKVVVRPVGHGGGSG
jgi:hypothetical protein